MHDKDINMLIIQLSSDNQLISNHFNDSNAFAVQHTQYSKCGVLILMVNFTLADQILFEKRKHPSRVQSITLTKLRNCKLASQIIHSEMQHY